LRLHLPLDANVNHKSTMFGGSLYCGAVLAGWGWLHLRLREEGIEDGHIVIQEGQISYPLPVTGDANAICPAPEKRCGSVPDDVPALRAGAVDAGDADRECGSDEMP
jgi:thioesterase domain-containing protein